MHGAAKATNSTLTGVALLDACNSEAIKYGTDPLFPDYVAEYKYKNNCRDYLEKSGENEKCVKKVLGM
jgi:hypothetical protein